MKISLKLLVKSFLQSILLLINWNKKTLNKTNCRALDKSLLTLCKLVEEELSNCYDYFLRYSGFPDLFGKVFWSLLNFPNLIFQLNFCKSNQKNTIVFLRKENAQFIFLCNPQKSSVNILLVRNFKKHFHKKSNCAFL